MRESLPLLLPWTLRETSKGLFICDGPERLCRVTARHDKQLRLLLAAPRLWNTLVRLSARHDLPDDVRLTIHDVLQHAKPP